MGGHCGPGAWDLGPLPLESSRQVVFLMCLHVCERACVRVCVCGRGEHGMAVPSPGDRGQNAPSGCPSVPGRRWPSLGGGAT